MIPQQFVAKWSQIQLKEITTAQSHFLDVCQLVGHRAPLDQIEELDYIHNELDTAVLAAYGWPPNFTDEQILERLLALNLQRAAVQEEDR
jgi:hypothetical protein